MYMIHIFSYTYEYIYTHVYNIYSYIKIHVHTYIYKGLRNSEMGKIYRHITLLKQLHLKVENSDSFTRPSSRTKEVEG